jgi:hypothetical protein
VIFSHLQAKRVQPVRWLSAPPIDWAAALVLAQQASGDLGLAIDSSRADALIALWQTCPTCVPVASPTDATISYPVLKALMGDIEAKKDIACGCEPYSVTDAQVAIAQANYASSNKKLPFGWGVFRFDANGNVATVDNTIVPRCPINMAWSASTKRCVSTQIVAAQTTSSSGSGGLILLLLGAAGVAALAFTAGAGGKQQALDRTKVIGRQGYEYGKAQAARAGRAAQAHGAKLSKAARARAVQALSY